MWFLSLINLGSWLTLKQTKWYKHVQGGLNGPSNGCLSTLVIQKFCLGSCVGVCWWVPLVIQTYLPCPSWFGWSWLLYSFALEVLFPSNYMAVLGEYLLPTWGSAGICCVVLHTPCSDCCYGVLVRSVDSPGVIGPFIPGLVSTVVNNVVIFLK